ncbi:hypothetical protein BKA62DRAFT_802484 [Auriculariales sp. MPI-PUGE-AT-0066]|nr:hypothetical protein BKA62DRAFT_802484 [Auriculariales sp. MPI-PUGE-AT-0066]
MKLVSGVKFPRETPPPLSLNSNEEGGDVDRAASATCVSGQSATVNTNVIALDLGSLAPENFGMLDVVHLDKPPPSCADCSAVVAEAQDCSFCVIRVPSVVTMPSQLFRASATVLEYKPSDEQAAQPASSPDTGIVLFCIDVSRSMDPDAGKKLSVPREASRLDYVKDAVCAELAHLADTKPAKRVGILSFSTRTWFFAPDMTTTIVVRLPSGPEQTLGNAMTTGESIIRPKSWTAVGAGVERLRAHVMGLKAKESTALGDCLAIALGVVRAHAPQGQAHEIYLCTDGESHQGLGHVHSLDDSNHGREFYQSAGEMAASLNTKVHVIGISGEGVALDVIAAAAQASGGMGSTFEAFELQRGLHSASQKRVASKDLSVTLQIQPGWRFTYESSVDCTISPDERVLTYARAQADDSACVSFSFSSDHSRASLSNLSPKSVTLQARMTWVTISGEERVRVIQHTIPTSSDHSRAEKHLNAPVITMHTLQRVGARMRQLLVEGITRWTDAQDAAEESRAALVSLSQTISHGVQQFDKREASAICATKIEQLDLLLQDRFGRDASSPEGKARDALFLEIDGFANISRDALIAASRKTARIIRASELP